MKMTQKDEDLIRCQWSDLKAFKRAQKQELESFINRKAYFLQELVDELWVDGNFAEEIENNTVNSFIQEARSRL